MVRGGHVDSFVRRWFVVCAVAGAAVVAVPAAAATRPPGAAKPTPGSGMGTAAAMEAPTCQTGEQYGPYGRTSSTFVGGGPVCVRPWRDGADNGGATTLGVTADAVTVVVIVPTGTQLVQVGSGGSLPVNRADNSTGTFQDAVHDYVSAVLGFYETWGRDLDIRFIESSGDDEAAQRADAVRVRAERPFAVLNLVTKGLDVLDADLARDEIIVFGYATTPQRALAQAPYRWGQTDSQAAAINSAEVLGKQLVGKKAEFGGDDVRDRKRVFGAVAMADVVDLGQFRDLLEGHGGKLAATAEYPGIPGSTFGDPAVAQEHGPVIVSKLKEAGVTTVVLFTDYSLNQSLMEQATAQEWYPEWFYSGMVFHDIALLNRTLPQDQAAHAFGISGLSPYVQPDPDPAPPEKSLTVLVNPLNWYWGEGRATSLSTVPPQVTWLLNGINAAGPKLTPKTFRQGLFALPATGGAAQGYPTGTMTAYGRNAGLPYDSYLSVGIDFAPVWWDPDTTGPSQGTGAEGQGVQQYADGAKRHTAATVPKRSFGWFEPEASVFEFETRPTPTPVYVGDCATCPSQGGAAEPGTPSPAGFVAPARRPVS